METKSKNKKMRVKLYLITLASCIVLAAVCAVLAIPDAALAKKPGSGGPGGDTQDIPVCVTVNDTGAIASDGSNYCNNKKEHVYAIVGRRAGQFGFNSNTNNSDGGRTWNFTFDDPVDRPQADEGPDPLFSIPGSVAPKGVQVKTARERVGDDNGYVDLRAMGDTNSDGVFDAGEEAALPVSDDLAVKIELIVTGEQHAYALRYRSNLWSPDDAEHYNPKLNETDLLTVTRTSKTTWTIESGASAKALLNRRLDWNNGIEIGIFEVPISLTIETLP